MDLFSTWITEKDGKVGRIRQVDGDKAPGPEWRRIPNDWGGSPGDDLTWLDEDGRRIPDTELVKEGKREDNRGRWYHTEKIGESVQVYMLDEKGPGEEYTREKPLENEPYQKWDPEKEKFVVDVERKEEAEIDNQIAEKKSALRAVELDMLRSFIAIQSGRATEEDEQYFANYSAQIETLREELHEIER
jgi:hypothetical protein